MQPGLRFATWVGGDRDSHALVTAETTRLALRRLRVRGMKVIDGQLEGLCNELSLSARIQPPPADLIDGLRDAAFDLDLPLGEVEHDDEPWRAYAELLRKRLRLISPRSKLAVMAHSKSDMFDNGLARLQHALSEVVGAERIARAYVLPVREHLQVFESHLARLDVRQNSGWHDKAISQILQAAGVAEMERHGLIGRSKSGLNSCLKSW